MRIATTRFRGGEPGHGASGGSPVMGQAQQKHRAVLIVEDDAELRHLTAALFEDEKVDTIECESAEAALAVMLIGGREGAVIFAAVLLLGATGRGDLASAWPCTQPCAVQIGTRARECGFPSSDPFENVLIWRMMTLLHLLAWLTTG